MDNIGSRIRKRREELGITQEELSTKLGYKNKSSIAKIEIGANDIPQSKVVAFANALDTTIAFLMGWEDEAQGHQSAIDAIIAKHPGLHPIERRKFPMLGSVACGKPILANEEYDSFVMADANIDADYCLTAKGDSMINARIFDGDIIFIKSMEIVDNGDIAAVCVNDDEVALKRFYYDRNAQIMRLLSENPTYAPMVFVGEELNHVHVLGKAVFFQSIVR